MTGHPSFNTTVEAIEFIRACLRPDNQTELYSAFTQETSEFWKDRLVRELHEVEAAETLEGAFLENGKITSFPAQETVLHLGGHDPRMHYMQIKLVKRASDWTLESIHICR